MLNVRRLPRLAALFASALLASSAHAQISRDDTAGQIEGDLTPIANVYTINGADGIRAGANDEIVVHSMSEFNLAVDEVARYTDDAGFINDVTNVLTRVTGGNASVLEGRIESLYPNADLFFVNPNGVFFGAGFTIDVPGSFQASTADSLEWEQGVSIDMGLPTDIPVITAAVPLAWGFLGAGPEKLITVEGFAIDDQAQIDQGETIGFIGGDVTVNMNSAFQTKGRDFLAVAVGTAGAIAVDPVPTRAALGANTPNGTLTFGLFGVDVSNSTGTDNGPFGGDFTLLGGTVDVTVGGNAFSSLGTGFGTSFSPANVDDSGDFTIIGDDVQIQGSPTAFLSTESTGEQGSFVIDASDSITFVDDVRLFSRGFRLEQDAGDVTLTAGGTLSGQLLVAVGADARADGGTVQISADVIDFQNTRIGTSAETAGLPGDITVTARTISWDGTGINSIFAGSIDSRTAGGNVLIEATESLEFTEFGINVSNTGALVGDGGNVEINAPVATADAAFVVDVSSALGNDGTFTGTAFPMVSDRIVRDSTAGQIEGPIAPVGDIYEINGNDGIRRNNDAIVIHSFDQFALEDFETAQYTDDAGFLD